MADRRYEPDKLSSREAPFKCYFDRLATEFGEEYEIWVAAPDYGRTIAAGVVNPKSGGAATVYFQHRSIVIPNPLNDARISRIRNHLESGTAKDIKINVIDKGSE